MTTVALIGAGGKMGCRITDNMKNQNGFRLMHVEVGEAGRQNLADRGVTPLAAEEALPAADMVVLGGRVRPADLTGEGDLFMLTVRGQSMIELGILDGDFVVARVQQTAEPGDVVVAGLPGEEATVKTFRTEKGKTVLVPANATMDPIVLDPDDVQIFGRVVTVMRRL